MPSHSAPNVLSRYLLRQAYNNAWSDHRLLRACSALTQQEFEDRTRTSFFPGIKATLNHNLTVQRFYVDALVRDIDGQPPHPDYKTFFRPPEPYGTCAALWQAQRENNDVLIAYCARLTDDALEHVVTILRGDDPVRDAQRDTRARLLAHVFQHQIHHRGQVHAMLSGTSVIPPQLDEFYSSGEADLRAQDFAELGWTEEQVWR